MSCPSICPLFVHPPRGVDIGFVRCPLHQHITPMAPTPCAAWFPLSTAALVPQMIISMAASY